MGVDDCKKDPIEIALQGIDKLKSFFRSLGMPVSLGEVGISEDAFEEMAEKCAIFGDIGNFVCLNKKDIIEIYRLAL